MNTGVQRSSATPPGARTNTTMPVGDSTGARFGQGKDVPAIAMAHEIPYVATATVAELRDLEAKVRRAMEFRGARYIHILVPCPLGWGHRVGGHHPHGAPRQVKPGLFPVFEAEHGAVTHVSKIQQQAAGRGVPAAAAALRSPVQDAAADGHHRTHPAARGSQHPPLRAARQRGAPGMKAKPFAITLDPGSSLANHTGSWRTVRPVYVDRLPPCNHACPAGENIQGWLFHAESGRLRAGLAAADRGQPAAGGDGSRLLPPVRNVVQPRPARRRASASTPSSASSATRRCARAGSSMRPRRRRARRCWSSARARPGLSAAYHLARFGHAVTIREAGPVAGGMMRFGIPKYRLPREVLDAEVQRILEPRRAARARLEGDERPAGEDRGRVRRGVPRGRRTHRQARLHPGRQRREDARRRLGAAQHGGRREAVARPPRRGLRRRQHRVRRRAHGKAPRRDRIDHRLPAHAREDARARIRARGGAAGRRAGEVAVDDQAGRRVLDHRREDAARREGQSRSRRASSRRSRRTRWCWRSARTWTSRCSTAYRASRSRTASSRSTAA